MKDVVGLAMRQFMAFRDIPFYMGAHSAACVPRTIEKVAVVGIWSQHGWNQNLYPPFRRLGPLTGTPTKAAPRTDSA